MLTVNLRGKQKSKKAVPASQTKNTGKGKAGRKAKPKVKQEPWAVQFRMVSLECPQGLPSKKEVVSRVKTALVNKEFYRSMGDVPVAPKRVVFRVEKTGVAKHVNIIEVARTSHFKDKNGEKVLCFKTSTMFPEQYDSMLNVDLS